MFKTLLDSISVAGLVMLNMTLAIVVVVGAFWCVIEAVAFLCQ